jgi:RHS repeat-associated protein
VVSGYVVDEATDLSLPGLIPLVWKRYYSSSRRGDVGATLGPGWAHGFEQQITEEARTITLRDGEGRSIWFEKIRPGERTFHRRERMTLSREGDGRSYRVTSHATRLTLVFEADTIDAPARLCSIRDAWDNAIELAYDGPRLSRVIDTAGRELGVRWKESRITRLELRAEGRLEQWVDYGYSTAGCLTTVTDALGGTEAFEYDRFHRMTAATIKTGTRFAYEYEANTGRCKKTGGPKGLHAIELRTDRATRTTIVEGEEPRVVTWNDDGLATQMALPDGTVLEQTAYDQDAFVVARVNGAGEGEQYWYDARGNRIRTVGATGAVTVWEHDEQDLPKRRITADGLATSYTHDDRGALTGVEQASGLRHAFSYDGRGRLTEVREGSTLVRGFEYDAQHNISAEIDAGGARTTYSYDGLGRPVARTDALGRRSRISYDRLGRPSMLRFPDGSTVARAYDALGKLVRTVDPLGRATTMERGGMGVLTRMTCPDGRQWSLSYTSKERVKEVKNPLGESYTFVHDEAGRVVEEKTFDGRVIRYRYSESSRIERIAYPDGTWRSFSYDRAGSLLGEEASDGSRARFGRDRMGRLVVAALEEGGREIVTQFERDPLGRVIAERQGDRLLRFAYDARGRRVSRVLPDGASTRYGWSAAGALTRLTHEGHELVFERDVLGREIQRGDAEGKVAIHQTWDQMDRLIEQRATAPSPDDGTPTPQVMRRWQYDRAGRVTRLDDGRWGTTVYSHDRAERLIEASRGAHRELFSYDAASSLVGALEGLGGRAEPWKVGPGNVLKQAGAAIYHNDACGRRAGKLARVEAGPGSPGHEEETRYVWDVRSRLREIELPSGERVRMTYDALGRRVRKEIVSTSGAARAVDFVWDGDVVAADLDSTRGARNFVHHPFTLAPLLQQERGGLFTYVNDQLGTPLELLDRAGRVAWATTHSSWGKVTEIARDPAQRGRDIDSPFRLLGQYADEETGLCCTRYRHFDPAVGRWCSPDPVGLGGGANLFAWDGAPTLSIDPLGLSGTPHPPEDTVTLHHAPKAANADDFAAGRYPAAAYPEGVYMTTSPQQAGEYGNSYGGGAGSVTMSRSEYDQHVASGAIRPDPDPAARARGSVVVDPAVVAGRQVDYAPADSYAAYDRYNIR